MPSTFVNFNPSWLTLAAFIFIVASVIVWWIVRKKRNRVWLPTLRLIKEESNPLPKIKIKPPPFLLFLCFLGSALTMLFLSSEPSQRQYRDISSNISKIHFFIDMSPSTEATRDENTWGNFLRSVFDYFTKQGIVSIGVSGQNEVKKFSTAEEFVAWIKTVKHHKAGLKLGRSVHSQLEEVGSIDKLVVISDQDKYSWSDFNWKYLETKMEVIRASPTQNVDHRNIFVDRANLKSSESGAQVVWKVGIARNFSKGLSNGVLKAQFGERVLAQTAWQIHDGLKSVSVEVQWPWSKWGDIVGVEKEINWFLETTAPNALKLDDQFKTKPHGLQKDILIVSEPDGEMFLEDSIHHLKIALDVLGFRVQRLDTIVEDDSLWKQPLWIVAGGNGPMEEFCPLQYEARRINSLNSQATSSSLPIVWLVPKDLGASYKSLCWCYSRLIESKSISRKMPIYCEDVETRDQYISVLQSMGAQQIGGAVGDSLGSLAWHRKIENTKAEVFAFTVPLTPSRRTGISYDILPTIAKTFLNLSYLLNDQGENKKSGWPRLTDIPQKKSDDTIFSTNVPRGESLFVEEMEKNLPPSWTSGSSISIKSSPGVREEDDPRMWIEVAFWILVALSLLEGGWLFAKYVRGQGNKIASTLILLLCVFGADTLKASVKLNLVGYSLNTELGETLSRDVAGRTSISLNETLGVFPALNDLLLREPWFWVNGRNFLRGGGGDALESVKRYLRRGGFIVIENEGDIDDLKSVINLPKGVWKAIPPDHEIMRSFHLLDSLPKCKNQVWLGYHFDDRIAAVAIPYGFVSGLLDVSSQDSCAAKVGRERATRIFINILMVALATDYKKDQIHLPEILKRLR